MPPTVAAMRTHLALRTPGTSANLAAGKQLLERLLLGSKLLVTPTRSLTRRRHLLVRQLSLLDRRAQTSETVTLASVACGNATGPGNNKSTVPDGEDDNPSFNDPS